MKKTLLRYKLGRRIAKLRKEKGLTQEQLAESSGKIVNTISNVECGKGDPRISTYEAIADGLGMDFISICLEAHYTPVIYSPTLENLIKRLQHEDEKTIKIIADIADNILSAKKK